MREISIQRKGASVAFAIVQDDGTEVGQIWLQGNLWYAENTQGWQVRGPINDGFHRHHEARNALIGEA